MKNRIKTVIRHAVESAIQKSALPAGNIPEVETEEPKHEAHGDFSSNIAMISASVFKMAPRKIAEVIVAHIDDTDHLFKSIEIAGPGFINFHMNPSFWLSVIKQVETEKERFGASEIGQGEKIQVEFVSSNPTGPLHVGHGRGAAVGDALANILSLCGYDVQKEYYINDSGRQIATLGRSVFLRYKELLGEAVEFPAECYQGDYIRDIAAQIKSTYGDGLQQQDDAVLQCARFAVREILTGMKKDLTDFGVVFDVWFSEQSLYDDGKVDMLLEKFKKNGLVYEKDGAWWFETTRFGDEKDRAVVKANGDTTYFASDIPYHQNKFERGFERIIDIWGADHAGYIPRMKAAVEALGYDPQQLHILLVNMVNLLRDNKPVAMSTRAGEFVTLKEVVDEVGKDAARFIFLTRHHQSPLDFDLEVAKQKTNDNPVYYVQYVHARISSIEEKALERFPEETASDDKTLARLIEPEEIALLKMVSRYTEVLQLGGKYFEPHRIPYYLMNLASAFHGYYNKHRVLTDDPELVAARRRLVAAIKQVIRNGLDVLGVSAPEKM